MIPGYFSFLMIHTIRPDLTFELHLLEDRNSWKTWRTALRSLVQISAFVRVTFGSVQHSANKPQN